MDVFTLKSGIHILCEASSGSTHRANTTAGGLTPTCAMNHANTGANSRKCLPTTVGGTFFIFFAYSCDKQSLHHACWHHASFTGRLNASVVVSPANNNPIQTLSFYYGRISSSRPLFFHPLPQSSSTL